MQPSYPEMIEFAVSEQTDLSVDRARAIIKGNFRDDVFFAEAAGVNSSNCERIGSIEPGKGVTNDLLGLSHFLTIGSGCVDQHVDTGVTRRRRRAAREHHARYCQTEYFHDSTLCN